MRVSLRGIKSYPVSLSGKYHLTTAKPPKSTTEVQNKFLPPYFGKQEMKITPIFRWFDFWVGLFWDVQKQILYIFPLPTLGVKIEFNTSTEEGKQMKLKLYLAMYRLDRAIDKVVAWFEKDMPKPGGPLPSLTDVDFLRREGYTLCIKDIHSFMQLTQTQSDQLVLVRLIEHLNRKGGK
jgi:hypothetical protein